MAERKARAEKTVLSRQEIATRRKALAEKKAKKGVAEAGPGQRALLGLFLMAVSILSLVSVATFSAKDRRGPGLPERGGAHGPPHRRGPAGHARDVGLSAPPVWHLCRHGRLRGQPGAAPLAAAGGPGAAHAERRGAGPALHRHPARPGPPARGLRGRHARRHAGGALLHRGHHHPGDHGVRRRAHRRHPVHLPQAVLAGVGRGLRARPARAGERPRSSGSSRRRPTRSARSVAAQEKEEEDAFLAQLEEEEAELEEAERLAVEAEEAEQEAMAEEAVRLARQEEKERAAAAKQAAKDAREAAKQTAREARRRGPSCPLASPSS